MRTSLRYQSNNINVYFFSVPFACFYRIFYAQMESKVDLSLPRDALHSIGRMTTSDGVQVHAFVEKVAFTTQIMYHNPTDKVHNNIHSIHN
jgi:hypothetical protein